MAPDFAPSAEAKRVPVTPAGRRRAEEAANAWFAAQQATRGRLGREGVAALDTLTRLLTEAEE